MKNLAMLLIVFLPVKAFLQIPNDGARNKVWIAGYGYDPNTDEHYHVFFDFRSDSLVLKYKIVTGSLIMDYTNNSICDTVGNLLFFSNGCGVMDADFQYVPGAEHINDGETQNYLCEEIGGGVYTNTLLILPDTSGTVYNLIHSRVNNHAVVGPVADRLFWSKIETDHSGNLLGTLVDSVIIDTFLYLGNMTSCRHANGNDWWIVAPGYSSETNYILDNRYYIIKISANSVVVQQDTIGIPTDDAEHSSGEAVFSPDGTKYARYTIHADLQIFDFDRCTGTFSNPIHVPIVDAADTSYAAGVAFSPSGRYLYVSSTQYIYQFDMQAADMAASKTTVAVYDGFYYPIVQSTNRFYQCELGPDGKIYVSCPGGKYTFHVIEHPDSAGLSCQVVQHKYILDYPIIGGLPHFPNFRLGALPGGACPSVPVVEVGEEAQGGKVYPNPASTLLYVEYEGLPTTYRLFNILGGMPIQGNITPGLNSIPLEHLADGIYFLSVKGIQQPVKIIISQ